VHAFTDVFCHLKEENFFKPWECGSSFWKLMVPLITHFAKTEDDSESKRNLNRKELYRVYTKWLLYAVKQDHSARFQKWQGSGQG
jgi:hypothetical protein